MMGTGVARGDDRAQAAAEAAIKNPLLDDVTRTANGVLVNITSGSDLTMSEFDEIGRVVSDFASEDATVTIGTSLDPNMQDEVKVTVVATGLSRARQRVCAYQRTETTCGVRFEPVQEPSRRPQVELVALADQTRWHQACRSTRSPTALRRRCRPASPCTASQCGCHLAGR